MMPGRISLTQTCLWLEVPYHRYFYGQHFSNSHGSAFPIAATLPHSLVHGSHLKNSHDKRSLPWKFKTSATNPSMAKVTICCGDTFSCNRDVALFKFKGEGFCFFWEKLKIPKKFLNFFLSVLFYFGLGNAYYFDELDLIWLDIRFYISRMYMIKT